MQEEDVSIFWIDTYLSEPEIEKEILLTSYNLY